MTVIQEQSIKLKGTVEFVLRDEHGNVKETGKVDNLIVDIGFQNLTNLISGLTEGGIGPGTEIQALALGFQNIDSLVTTPTIVPTPALTDINMPGVGSGQAWASGRYSKKNLTSTPTPLVISQPSIKSWRYVAIWGANEPSNYTLWGATPGAMCPIQAFGTFWAAAGTADNKLFSWTERAIINKGMSDSLEITYTYSMA